MAGSIDTRCELVFQFVCLLDSLNFENSGISGFFGGSMFLKIQGFPLGSSGFQKFRNLYAGGPGMGAEDAWMTTAL